MKKPDYRNKTETARRKKTQHIIHKEHGVSVNYYHVDHADEKSNMLLNCNITLPNGRNVQFFVNRDTGLIVVDVVAKSGNSGNEVLRINANNVAVE